MLQCTFTNKYLSPFSQFQDSGSYFSLRVSRVHFCSFFLLSTCLSLASDNFLLEKLLMFSVNCLVCCVNCCVVEEKEKQTCHRVVPGIHFGFTWFIFIPSFKDPPQIKCSHFYVRFPGIQFILSL